MQVNNAYCTSSAVFKFSLINFRAFSDVPLPLVVTIASSFEGCRDVCRKCFFGERSLCVEERGVCDECGAPWENPVTVIPSEWPTDLQFHFCFSYFKGNVKCTYIHVNKLLPLIIYTFSLTVAHSLIANSLSHSITMQGLFQGGARGAFPPLRNWLNLHIEFWPCIQRQKQ